MRDRCAHLTQADDSVRRHLSDVRLIVYDLGFSDSTRLNMSTWPSVEFRRFDFQRHPAWHDVTVRRGEYGWKPVRRRSLRPR